MSPELQDAKRSVVVNEGNKNHSTLQVNLDGVKLYAVAMS